MPHCSNLHAGLPAFDNTLLLRHHQQVMMPSAGMVPWRGVAALIQGSNPCVRCRAMLDMQEARDKQLE